MKQFDFTLGFSVMASDELDARVKLKDLLKAISKEEILWAMSLVDKPDPGDIVDKLELDGADAKDLLDMLDLIMDSIDEHVYGDDSPHIDPSLWDDYHKGIALLAYYGLRAPMSLKGRPR
jgi:hypothetical protein